MMAARVLVKIDEDLPLAVAGILREAGYDAASVLDEKMGGWKDDAVWRIVQSEHRLLVTADKGFADTRSYPPGTHSGIVLLRPDQDGARPTTDLIRDLVASHNLSDFAGAIVVVTARGIRVRRSAG
ncbi:MAG: DUF5615 family PIN-like protein [Armatimonadota bacterium]|nr:DUF5615 family PIN-like protein [Armatimonadota bacterium]